LNPHGTRVLQKLIEVLSNDELISLFTKLFSPNILNFIKDINGNHIIQKFIFTVQSPKNQFLYDRINSQIIEIGTHKHGCCVLQKCIEGGIPSQRVKITYKLGLIDKKNNKKYTNFGCRSIWKLCCAICYNDERFFRE